MVDGAYLAAGPAEGNKKAAVVLLTDIFGLPLKNSKILADIFAERLGVDVWVPDLFAGAYLFIRVQLVELTFCVNPGKPPVKVEELEPLMPDRAGVKTGFMSTVRLILLMLSRPLLVYNARPSAGVERAKAVCNRHKLISFDPLTRRAEVLDKIAPRERLRESRSRRVLLRRDDRCCTWKHRATQHGCDRPSREHN